MSLPKNEMLLSIIIPAYNEQDNIENTCVTIINFLTKERITFDILVVNDHSTDRTEAKLQELSLAHGCLSYLNNPYRKGFGNAVRTGLENFKGDAACIVMADLSDSPKDIAIYYKKLNEGYECVFGSRFIKGSKIIGYPKHKLIVNRLANWFIKILFGFDYNDTTNAFKAYHRKVVAGISPIISPHFNLTVELPLKSIVRGYSYTIVPIAWTNRVYGVSKLKLKEMGSRYLFIVLYVFLEKLLSKKDYHRSTLEK